MTESKTVTLPDETMQKLIERAQKCFTCWWTHEDFRLHKKLTGWPFDYFGSGTFPVEGKIKHLELEGFSFLISLTSQ